MTKHAANDRVGVWVANKWASLAVSVICSTHVMNNSHFALWSSHEHKQFQAFMVFDCDPASLQPTASLKQFSDSFSGIFQTV